MVAARPGAHDPAQGRVRRGEDYRACAAAWLRFFAAGFCSATASVLGEAGCAGREAADSRVAALAPGGRAEAACSEKNQREGVRESLGKGRTYPPEILALRPGGSMCCG